jgi:predicted N-acyltransferase
MLTKGDRMALKIETADSIRDVDEQEWITLLGTDRVDGSHGWYRAIEDSGIRISHYVLVREDGNLAAAACCRICTEKIYTVKMPFLDVRPVYFDTFEQADMLVRGLEEVRKKEKAKGFLFFFHDKEKLNCMRNQLKYSTEFPVGENTYIDLNFKDFDDYLSSLNTTARRSARNTLNRARRWEIQPVFTNELSRWKKVARSLHGYVCEQHNDYRQHFPESFYEALEKNLKERAELIMFFKDNTPLAFGLSLNSKTTSLYKIAGLDPEYRRYHAYFLIYYEGIRKAIERGQKRIYFGPTAYELKERIGCSLQKCFGLAKMGNPALNMMLKIYITSFKLLGKKF